MYLRESQHGRCFYCKRVVRREQRPGIALGRRPTRLAELDLTEADVADAVR